MSEGSEQGSLLFSLCRLFIMSFFPGKQTPGKVLVQTVRECAVACSLVVDGKVHNLFQRCDRSWPAHMVHAHMNTLTDLEKEVNTIYTYLPLHGTTVLSLAH